MNLVNVDTLFTSTLHFHENLADALQKTAEGNDSQTMASFSEKWNVLDEGDTKSGEDFQKKWVLELYGFKTLQGLKDFLNDKKVIIDAGCGLGYKSAWLAEHAPDSIVFGVDYSESVTIAARRYKHIPNLFFIRAGIDNLPFKKGFVDFVFCDQVIHHTADPQKTFAHLSGLLSDKGKLACYVYAKKALPRELLDDHFRKASHGLSYTQLWELSGQLTELGKNLSALHVKFVSPDIPALGIKGGEYDLQRFVYWNFIKCFWNPAFTKEINDATNFDWYAPSNAARYEPEEFKSWAQALKLNIDFFRSEEACHTMIVSR